MTANPAEAELAHDRDAATYATPDAAYQPPARGFLRQAMVDTFDRFGAQLGAAWIILLVTGAVFAPFIASSFPVLIKQNGAWSSPMLQYITPADVTLLVAFFAGLVLIIRRRVPFATGLAGVAWLVVLTLPFAIWPSIAFDHWLPGAEKMGRRFGIGLLVIFAFAELIALIAIPLFSRAPAKTKLGFGITGAIIAIALLLFHVRPPQIPVYEMYRENQTAGAYQKIVRPIVQFSPNDYQRDDPDALLQAPSWKHWMGTEGSGADVFSRMLHASRIALSIGFIATGISVIIGVTVGGFMGYFGGLFDIIGMRFIEMLEAVPVLILLLTVCAFFGVNLYLMMVIIGLFSWTGNARFVRAEFFRLRNQDFVHAAIANGLPLRSVIFRHMLPNGITSVLVNTSFGVASAILYESTLSFLGLGLVDEPSWGQLLNQARAGGAGFHWWIATFPGLAIFFTVFAYNLIGESMRDALDPKLRKRD